MAVCNSPYRITVVNIREKGRSSDGTIFSISHLGISFDFTYVLVGDETFHLKEYLMQTYPEKVLGNAKRIFGYRLSRARKTT